MKDKGEGGWIDLLHENGEAKTSQKVPEPGGKSALAEEEPILELLAEGATSIRQVEGYPDSPVNGWNLEEPLPFEKLDDPLNFSLEDFPLPPPIQQPDFPEPVSAEVTEPQAKAEPEPLPGDSAQQVEAKRGFRDKLKGMLSYRLTVTRVGGFATGKEEVEGEEPPPPKKKRPVKQVVAKKARPKRPKGVKAARPKASGLKQGQSNRKKQIIVASAGIAILLGSVGAVLLTRSWQEPARLLDKAQQYMEDERYDKAISTYEKVIKTNELLPEAYLGMAEGLVASDDLEGALGKLSLGYRETQDERLSQRLAELDVQLAAGEKPEEASSPPSLSAEPIEWKDPAFESMVRLALNKPQGPISEADLVGITSLKILGSGHASVQGDLYAINGVDGYTIGGETYTQRGNITSLDDVIYFRDLTRLTVGYNQVRDISALGKMNLSTVSLYANDLSDLSPLEEVKTLRYLFLYNNNISDISPLAGLNELVCLSLQYNQIRDITPLAGLSQLQELYISHNEIEDLSPLKTLKHLTFLDAGHNRISNLDPVAGLEGLTDASFVGNPVVDYSPTSRIQNLNRPFGKTR